MALNFPNSPTNGQIYTDTSSGNRWSWDAANTAWISTSTFTQTITVSSTQPGSPVVGQLWWNQDYGRLLVYYNDGTSSQWVDASPSDATNVLAYSQANTVFVVANAAYANANTKLANTTGTLAGALTTTGSITSNGYVYVTASDGTNEGGEIQLSGAGNYAGWALDAYQNNYRTFVRTGSTLANVTYFHALGGSVRMGINKTDPLYTLDVSGDVNASGNLVFNSGYGSAATSYGTRVWLNYNAQGSSVRLSGGVSSVTKNATGDYTVNLSVTMPDTNYSYVVGISSYLGGTTLGGTPMLNSTIGNAEVAPTTTTFRFATCVWNAGSSGQDAKYLNLTVNR